MFSKILIANRGEVAVRIIRACKEMGISTVSVFSFPDQASLHVSLADESYCIGPAAAKDSYLNISAIITAALLSGAQAIHPGYGFLAENVEFVKACDENNLVFIGPSAETIEAMGNKSIAINTMKSAGIPTIPGTNVLRNAQEAELYAQEIGYPVLLKASSGGGGRGIRIAAKREELLYHFPIASAEAKNAFNDDSLYLEKFLNPVKHIETQILADKYGNVVCLGERDCSLQRKNQKLMEESPSSALSDDLRDKLTDLSIKAVKASNYINAGTLEFLLTDDGELFFMEMNTRLQVEHPITEMVTGIDLVKWQIRIAAGYHLTFSQKEIAFNGHAIECRINSEDHRNNYRPSCGKIDLLHIPGGPWVRFDTAIYQDYTILPFYDSMIGKLIVYARTREEAIRKMQASLCELVIEGIIHNGDLMIDLLSEDEIISGQYHTDYMLKRGI